MQQLRHNTQAHTVQTNQIYLVKVNSEWVACKVSYNLKAVRPYLCTIKDS